MLTELITEVDRILEAAIGKLPTSLQNPSNAKEVDAFESSLVKYFAKLEKAFPYSKLDSIYNKYVQEATRTTPSPAEIDTLLNPILARFDGELGKSLKDGLVSGYLSGSANMMTYGETSLGIEIAYEGPPMKEAVDFALKHISKAKLVDGINATTRIRIANAIAEGLQQKLGLEGMRKLIRDKFQWMGKGRSELGRTLVSRARMIALTESNNALSQAFIDRSKDMGIEYKEWLVVVPCEICAPNANQVIPMDGIFNSGHDRPPAHVNCVCSLAPAIKKGRK